VPADSSTWAPRIAGLSVALLDGARGDGITRSFSSERCRSTSKIFSQDERLFGEDVRDTTRRSASSFPWSIVGRWLRRHVGCSASTSLPPLGFARPPRMCLPPVNPGPFQRPDTTPESPDTITTHTRHTPPDRPPHNGAPGRARGTPHQPPRVRPSHPDGLIDDTNSPAPISSRDLPPTPPAYSRTAPGLVRRAALPLNRTVCRPQRTTTPYGSAPP